MTSKLHPYLTFKDNARQAMQFYQSVFGGKLDVGTFKDLGGSQSPDEDNLVMHASLEADNGISFFASDTPRRMEYLPPQGFSMSLSGGDESELRGYFDKLADGGTVTMPLEKAVWGDTFGMLTDRFGIGWLVNIHTGQG